MNDMNNLNAQEFPLSRPYDFEGFINAEADLPSVDELIGTTVSAASAVGVIREGQNNYGTWGYLFVWDGGQWVHQGYTLEPRSSVGKGPIPIGDFRFNRWLSPRLGKTLRLHNVPGFTDILVHVGNRQEETQGCILAGKSVDRLNNPTALVNSRVLTDWLYDTQSSGQVLVRSR